MASEIDLYECRFDVGSASSPHFLESPHGGVMVVAAREIVPAGAEVPCALLLVADLDGLGHVNPGASATNVMDSIVARFRVLAHRFEMDPRMLVWVELDSEGAFDMVYPAERDVTFGPLRSISGLAPARSAAALRELFPVLGPAVLARLPAPTAASHGRG